MHPFTSSTPLTLGVEIEAQLVDWRNQDLCPAAERVLALVGPSDRIKPEIFQSMIEVCTGVCADLGEVAHDLSRSQGQLLEACDELGIEVVGAGTHPFARLDQRLLFPAERYRMLIDRNQWIARRLAIFGLHVHVGIDSSDRAIHLMNALSPWLALLLALSASSPFIEDRDTGLASARSTVFESQPTAGSPLLFTDWAEFSRFSDCLHQSRSIKSLKDLWWDIRPNPGYGTVEVRICDGPANLSNCLALVGLIHCLATRAVEKIQQGWVPTPCPIWMMRENKWRAARWGVEADLIVQPDGQSQSLKEYTRQLLSELQPLAQRLNCSSALRRIEQMLESENGAVRQRDYFAQSGSTRAIVQKLAAEWRQTPQIPS